MLFYFAPLEGITGWLYRTVHHTFFPGLDKYYTPFLAPTADSPLTSRHLADLLPEHNIGVPLVPQLLTNRAEDFIAAARMLAQYGYREVNLNLGCPSGTVSSKKKGAGFLTLPQQLDQFLDTVFSALDLQISIKTRIGAESPEEWPALLEIFNRYPLCELTIHPRLRRDFYRNRPNLEAFRLGLTHSRAPVCYNGDLNTPADCARLRRQFPAADRLMFGRGLVANPALVRELSGGPPLEKEELRAFLAQLLAGYRAVLYGDRPVLGKMKELWYYLACLFSQPEPYLKRMRKARDLASYQAAADALFRDSPLVPGAGFSPPL